MKEGKINEKGTLEIKRPSGFVAVQCIRNRGWCCEHGCVMFGEPEDQVDFGGNKTGKIALDICKDKTLFFNKFTDERKT